eukprot:475135_1
MEQRKKTVLEHWMRLLFDKDIYLPEIFPIIIAYAHSDFLNLSQDLQYQQMLLKMSDINVPEPEHVLFSREIIKINKRRKEQRRIFLLTNKAIYFSRPKPPYKSIRLDLTIFTALTISTHPRDCNAFLIQCPEYGYGYRHIRCDNRDHIISLIRQTCEHISSCSVPLNETEDRLELSLPPRPRSHELRITREERYQQYKDFLEKVEYGNEIEDVHGKVTTQLMRQSEAVTADDFEFVKVIGRDKLGKFMLVHKKDSQQTFAMQIIRRNEITNISNTRYETRRKLEHPFLMQIRYAFQTDTKLYHVFDYGNRCELLFHLKKKRRFTELQAQFFVAQIALALGHLHSINVIYRELSPENTWLDDTGNIILTEQGLSIKTERDSFNGLPEYLSPELVKGSTYDKAVDWWCLGVLLYELTVGIPPFYAQNINKMCRKILEAQLLFPPNLSSDCKDLITKLLCRDPKQRLGAGPEDVEQIKTHSFFNNIEWDKLYRKDVVPPYKEDKCRDFDQELIFFNEPCLSSHDPDTELTGNDGFDDFCFEPCGTHSLMNSTK